MKTLSDSKSETILVKLNPYQSKKKKHSKPEKQLKNEQNIYTHVWTTVRWQNAGNLVLLLLMLSDENGGENEMKKKGILVRSEKEEKKKQAPQNEAVWRLLIRLFESRKREILSWPSTTHTGEEDHYCHGLFFFF